MRFFDQHFKDNKAQYIGQCTLATLGVFIILHTLDARSNAALVGSLGASTFIVFVFPQAHNSSPRFLLGGYGVGILFGSLCAWLTGVMAQSGAVPYISVIHFAALAVGLSIFVMVLTDTEHPPAAGVALGLVLNDCNLHSVLVVAAGIACLTALRTLLRPMMVNLI